MIRASAPDHHWPAIGASSLSDLGNRSGGELEMYFRSFDQNNRKYGPIPHRCMTARPGHGIIPSRQGIHAHQTQGVARNVYGAIAEWILPLPRRT